jgi:hypothetical protein
MFSRIRYTLIVASKGQSDSRELKAKAAKLAIWIGAAVAIGSFMSPASDVVRCYIALVGYSLILIGAIMFARFSPTGELFPVPKPERQRLPSESLTEKIALGAFVIGLSVVIISIFSPFLPEPANSYTFIIGGVIGLCGAIVYFRYNPSEIPL